LLLSQVIERCRRKLNDPSSKAIADRFWSDAEVAEAISTHQTTLAQRQVQADDSFFNQRIEIDGTTAVKIHNDVYEYNLPRWFYRIHAVREVESVGTELGRLSFPRRPRGRGRGFELHTRTKLWLYGVSDSDVPSLHVEASKMPARLHTGTVRKATVAGEAVLYLDDQTSMDLEQEVDRYRGSIFEITTAAAPVATRDPVGQLRVGTASVREFDVPLQKYLIKVTLDAPFSTGDDPIVGDKYEMHVEIDDTHINLLVVMAVESLFHKTNNRPGLASIQDQMLREWKMFEDSMQTRQDMEQVFVSQDPYDEVPRDDLDRDFTGGFYGGY